MDHWTQKCDGAGCSPTEYANVCRERDELQAALDGAKLSMKALNEKLVEITAERDALIEVVKRGIGEPCDYCTHCSVGLACDGDGDCATCETKCTCGTCDTQGSNFEFVGVKEEPVKLVTEILGGPQA